jgi:hypothetical protein
MLSLLTVAAAMLETEDVSVGAQEILEEAAEEVVIGDEDTDEYIGTMFVDTEAEDRDKNVER